MKAVVKKTGGDAGAGFSSWLSWSVVVLADSGLVLPPGAMVERTELVRELRQRLNLARRTLGRRLYLSRAEERRVVDDFHRLYFESEVFGGTWKATTWMGVPTRKCPLDPLGLPGDDPPAPPRPDRGDGHGVGR